MFWLTLSFTIILSGCEDANSAAGKGGLFCTLVYEAILNICKKSERHKIQDPASPECESQTSTLPHKSAVKTRSSYGSLFRQHQAETRAYLPSEKINICLCCPWTRPPGALIHLTLLYRLPRRRVAMPPQWFPWRQHTRKTAPVYWWARQKRAWMFVNSARSLSCQLQRGVWGASPKALFWISLWLGTVCQSQMKCWASLSFPFLWRPSELYLLKRKVFCVCTVRGSLVSFKTVV